jgi:hypothetical protein
MAVYQGARPGFSVRAGLRPRTSDASTVATPADTGAALPRRRVRGTTAVRANQRSNRVGIILGVIVVAFMLAFFSLAQSMRVSATGYELDRLIVERDRLEAQMRDLRSDVNRLGKEPAIRKQGLDMGLGPLGVPVVVDAR